MSKSFFARNKWKLVFLSAAVLAVGVWLAIGLYRDTRPLLIGVVITETPINFSGGRRLYATQTFHSEPMDNMPPEFAWHWVTLEFEGVDMLAYSFVPHYSVPVSDERNAFIHSSQSDTFIIESMEGRRTEVARGLFNRGRTRLINNQHTVAAVYVPLGSELVHEFNIYPVFQVRNGNVFLTELRHGNLDADSTVTTFQKMMDGSSGSSMTSPLRGGSRTAEVGAWASADASSALSDIPDEISREQLTWYRYVLIHRGVTFTVSVQEREAPFRVLIWEMDDTNTVINYTEYVPWELPNFPEWFSGDEWFAPAPETAYIIAEIHERTHAGTERILREFLTPQMDNWFEVAVLPPNGYIFENRGILFLWP